MGEPKTFDSTRFEAGGFAAISRGLSEATSPVDIPNQNERIPEGWQRDLEYPDPNQRLERLASLQDAIPLPATTGGVARIRGLNRRLMAGKPSA
jgi:hypothetical protein